MLWYIRNKLNNVLKITGNLNNVFRPQKTLKKTRIKLHNTLALPVLLYGSETWTIKAKWRQKNNSSRDEIHENSRINLDRIQNKWTNCKGVKITLILDKLLEYKRSWIQHVNRMPRNRLPRVMKCYFPTGRRNHGRPLKRLLDTWDRNGSTSGPTP